MGQRLLCTALTGVLAVLVTAPVAGASHNTVVKADKSQRSMVKPYQSCNSPTISDPALGGLACAAAVFNSNFNFGPKGMATLKITRVAPGKPIKDRAGTNYIPGAEDSPPYPFNREANETGDILYDLTASDVRDSVGDPASGGIGELEGYVRPTDHGCGGATCTLINTYMFAPQWAGASPATACSDGRCRFVSTLNIAAYELDPHILFGLFWKNTGTSNAVAPGYQAQLDESRVCFLLSGSYATCQGLIVGKADSTPEPPEFQRPMKAGLVRLPLVRAFAHLPHCGLTHVDPWALSGCAPSESSALLDFGPKGRGRVILRPGKSTTHGEIKVVATVTDVRQGPDNSLKAEGPVSVRFPVQVTHARCAGSVACTRPVQQAAVNGNCKNGVCRVSGVTDIKLPQAGISNVEIGRITGLVEPTADFSSLNVCVYDRPAGDATGKPFACPGTFIP